MNLVEHHIQKIYSVEDVSKEYEEKTGEKLDEPLLKIDLERIVMEIQKEKLQSQAIGNSKRKTAK